MLMPGMASMTTQAHFSRSVAIQAEAGTQIAWAAAA